MKLESIWIGVIAGLLVCCGMFGIFFLMGSFSQATTDLDKWSTGARSITAVLGGMLSIIFGIASGVAAAYNMEDQ